MTYFNPKIFNKQNLKEKDRKELECWNNEVMFHIDSVRSDFEEMNSFYGFEAMKPLVSEIVNSFCDELKERWGYSMQEHLVSCIENYDEDVQEIETPETFLYNKEEEEK